MAQSLLDQFLIPTPQPMAPPKPTPEEELLAGLEAFLTYQTPYPVADPENIPRSPFTPDWETLYNQGMQAFDIAGNEARKAMADREARWNPAPYQSVYPSEPTPEAFEKQRALNEYVLEQNDQRKLSNPWRIGDNGPTPPGAIGVSSDSPFQALGRLADIAGRAVPATGAIPIARSMMPGGVMGNAAEVALGMFGGDPIGLGPNAMKAASKVAPFVGNFNGPSTSSATEIASNVPLQTTTGAAQAMVRLRPQDFDASRAAALSKIADPSAPEHVRSYAEEVVRAIDNAVAEGAPHATFRQLGKVEDTATGFIGDVQGTIQPDDVAKTANTVPTQSTFTPSSSTTTSGVLRNSPNSTATTTNVSRSGANTTTPPPTPPTSTGPSAAGAARQGDLLNTRPVADVLNDSHLRDTGISGKIREGLGVGKVGQGLEHVHPGFTKPADDTEAITNEFRTLRTKYESTGNTIRQALDNTASRDPGNIDHEIGAWTGQAIQTAKNNNVPLKTIAKKVKELNLVLAGRTEHEKAELAANFIDDMLMRSAERWTKEAYKAIGNPIGYTKRFNLAKTGGRADIPFYTGLNDALTMVGASSDLSVFGIQMALAAPRHPKAFLSGVKHGFQAAFDPKHMGDFYSKNMDDVLDAANNGVVFSKGGMADALQGGAQVEKSLGNIPIVGGIFTGSNRLFAGAADAMRLGMWKSLRKNKAFANASEEELRELGKLLNRATGMTATQTTGIEQNVLFASRFFRSPIEFMGMALQPGKAGDEARAMAATFFGAATGFTLLFNQMLGKETVLDPDDPNFLRVQARDSAGTDVSLYGPMHPYIVALGKVAKHSVWDAAVYAKENGLDPEVAMIILKGTADSGANMLSTRLRPGLSTAKDIQAGEVFGGKSWNTTDNFWNWSTEDWAKFLGVMAVSHAVPFSVGGAIENAQFLQKLQKAGVEEDEVVLKEMIADTLNQLTGTRGAPPSMKERINRLIEKRNIVIDGKKINTLDELDDNPVARAEFYRDPHMKSLIEVYQGERRKDNRSRYYGYLEEQYKNQTQYDEWAQNKTTPKGQPYTIDDWEDDTKARYLKSEGARALFMKDNPEMARMIEKNRKERAKNPNLSALDGYLSLNEKFPAIAGSQKVDPALFEAKDAYLESLPEEQREFVIRNLGVSYTPFQRFVADTKRAIKPYFDYINDDSKIVDEEVKAFVENYRKASTKAELDELKTQPEYYAWLDIKKDLRRDMLVRHPEMIEKLKFLEYIKYSPSEEDEKSLKKANDSVASALKSIEKFKAAVTKREPFASANLKAAQNRLKMAQEKVEILTELVQHTKEVEAGIRSPEDAKRPPTSAELKEAAAAKAKDAEVKNENANKAADRATNTTPPGTKIDEPKQPPKPVATPKPAATPKITLPGRLW